MDAMGRSVAGAVAIVAVGGALAGCTSWSLDRGLEFEDNRSETAIVREIHLAGGDGAVTVERAAGTSVHIHRRVWYRDSRPAGRQDRLDGTTLVLDTRCGRNCTVSYTIGVPTEVNVTGHLDTGPIELSDVGTVTVDTSDGGIGVRNASGNVTLQTRTGPIRLVRIAGAVTARSQDGGITVQTSAKAVSVHTGTGPVELSDVAGTVAARSIDGGISMDGIAGQVTAETDTGPINGTDLSGTRTVAQTSDGPITLRLRTVQDVDARTITGPIALMVPQLDGGYQVHTRTTTGSTEVNVTTNPGGARSLTLISQHGGITINHI
jgi:hypothetical protein